MKMLVVNRKITMSILIVVLLVCGLQGTSHVAEALTVPNEPSFSEFVEAWDNDNDLFEELKAQATRLCAGLEFPRDTFAINDEFTILVAHTPEGDGLVLQGNSRFQAGGGINLGWLTLEKRGDLRVLTHYAPNGDGSIKCDLSTEGTAVSEPPGPKVLVVDPDSPPIYWTDYGTDKIQRVNLDGSNVQDLITSGLASPTGVALDVAGGKMYWVDIGTGKIQRANLDGTNVEDIGAGSVSSIALDVAGGKIYWTTRTTTRITVSIIGRTTRTTVSTIRRANLDGSNVEDLITRGLNLNVPNGIALDVAGGKMYWTDGVADKIRRANLDGSNIEDLVTGLSVPIGIALDVSGSKMYWTDGGTDKIQRANLDGSNVEDLVTAVSDPYGITLDAAKTKMYWTDREEGKIRRANLDGSNVEDLVTGLDEPVGITLAIPPQAIPSTPDLVVEDVRADPVTVAPGEKFKLYATLKNQGRGESTATRIRYYRSTDAVISTEDTQLGSASRDPLAANATIRRYLNVTAPTTPGTYYYGVCVDSVPDESDTDNNCSLAVSVTVTAPPTVAEDVNGDGIVDVKDLVYVAERYGQTGTTTADVNGDGVVNIDDLILVAAVLDADAAAAPSLYSDALEQFSVSDVQLWLSQARQRDVTDPRVRKGILFLEHLLASMVPKETVLLANYPNPFNPETWIPYQLAKPAEVTITIYAINGQAVRTLALGHQAVGRYQSRSGAAYWDGKNEFGEAVASGLYFYTLTAGDFSATRKMLIRK